MSRVAIVVFLLGLAWNMILKAEAQLATKSIQNLCANKPSCHECIQLNGCAWCRAPIYDVKQSRCFHYKDKSIACPEEYIWNPLSEHKLIEHFSLTRGRTAASSTGGQMGYGGTVEASSSHSSSASSQFSSQFSSSAYGHANSAASFSASGSSSKIVQIYPQRVSLKLRLNEVYSLPVQYSQAEQYPVDLYYLMDLSKSMEDDKDKLSTLGGLLTDTMRNMTSDFRLGFGSFVDKVLMPFVSTAPDKLKAPCVGCVPAYGYHNHMSLSNNTSQFATEVNKSRVSGNLDSPEGGFDAIMQSIVCKEQIGWREHARHLLVFSTDAGFHYAGDGKLAGVIEPNDGECHLGASNYYTHSSVQDYPSIAQINSKVKEHSISLIFAVTALHQDIYNNLTGIIEGSSCATLSNDSSNVVKIVSEEYNKMTSNVQMKDNATNHIKITYYSKCLSDTEMPVSNCSGLREGDVVEFTAKITITSCPENPNEWKQFVNIYPVGINESLVIDLEMLCSCPCEQPGSEGYEQKSKLCNGHGDYKCGICECDNTYIGHKCECSNTDNTDNNTGQGCRPDNTTQLECSGRGTCTCGVCECATRPNPAESYSGTYCECDNFTCDRQNQQLCSGHGTCHCGTCVCESGWSGSACDCQTSNHTCIAPNGNGELCSGHGKCECGVCKCTITDERRYSGKYCDKCPTCAKRCDDLRYCVQCQMFKSGPLKDSCHENCTAFTPTSVGANMEVKEDEYTCSFFDEDDCKFYFKYTEIDDKLTVYAQEERECPPKVFMLGIVLGVIAAIVLIGLAILLLWKLLTTIHDRREFARFEKERMNAKWDTGENPIYKQATSTFKNPMYAGK